MIGNNNHHHHDDDVLKPLVEDETSAMELATLASPFARSSSLDELVENSNNNLVTTLRIKSSYGDTEVDIDGCPKTTIVGKLKSLVKEALSQKDQESNNNNNKSNDGFKDRRLRLICKGKLLSPDDSSLDEFKVTHGDVIHAVLGKPGSQSTTTIPARRGQRQREQHSNNDNNSIQNVLFRHQRRRRQRNGNRGTIVGPGGRVTRAPETDDSDHDEMEMGGERLGFDRLRSAGLSRHEVTAVRIYFNRHVDRFVQQQQQTDGGSLLHLDEPDLSRRRLLVEDEWMQTQGPTSEFRLNLNQNTLMRYASQDGSLRIRRPGNDRDFMWGFCLGFFVGVLGLVWVWIPSISHKQKLGILTGICFQLMLEGGSEQNFDQETSMFTEGSDPTSPLEWN